MTTLENPPVASSHFSVTDDEDGSVLAYCDDVKGLSGDIVVNGSQRIELVDCQVHGRLERWLLQPWPPKKGLGNVEINILGHDQRIIGAYYLGAASPMEYRSSVRVDGWNVALRGHLLSPAHPRALHYWNEWREHPPEQKGRWALLPSEDRKAWLEVVRLYRGERPADTSGRIEPLVFELDGALITDRAALFCALGEAIRGPGGYYGAGLDSVRDCLSGGFGVVPPFTLRWRHAAVARAAFVDSAETAGASIFDELVDILRGSGVTVEFV